MGEPPDSSIERPARQSRQTVVQVSLVWESGQPMAAALESTLQRELGHLRVTLLAFDTLLDRHFSGEEDESDAKTNAHRLKSARAVLLKLANDIVDQYGPFEDPTLPEGLGEFELARLRQRVDILWEVYAESLEKYGIVKTKDKKMFTYGEPSQESSDAG